jgi:hypothetical protein
VSAFPDPEDLTDEQSETLEKAAFLVINGRNEAAAMLMRSGVEPVPDQGWFGSPCGAMLPPPPEHHFCGCGNYQGDGGPCLTRYRDFTGPDIGAGSPIRTCGHRPSEHFVT